MLKVAAKHYLKSLGDKFFVPNPDNAEWLKVDCLDIAIKRRPKWFWQKEIYTYDHFGLDDLLDSPLPSDKSAYLKEPEPLTPNYSLSSKHSVKSKVGGTVASLVNLDLSADDSVSISIDFEDMMKQSINFVAVNKLLNTKKINFKNNYIRHIARNKNNVICLITQYIYLTKKTELKIASNWTMDESSTGKSAEASVDDKADVHSENSKTIVFDVGTRLAFDFAELLIGADGSIELIDRSEDLRGQISIPSDNQSNSPNYCAHITVDKQNFDIPDSDNDGKLSDLTKSLNSMVLDKTSLDVTRNLLTLALEEKKSLKEFELFMLECQHSHANKDSTVDLATFNISQIKNVNLLNILKQIGFDTQSTELLVPVQKLNFDIIDGIMIKVHAIYHLEMEYLTNLQNILNNAERDLVKTLFTHLQNVKNKISADESAYENLIKNSDIKFLMLSVGVTKNERNSNEYFEPTLILLHGS